MNKNNPFPSRPPANPSLQGYSSTTFPASGVMTAPASCTHRDPTRRSATLRYTSRTGYTAKKSTRGWGRALGQVAQAVKEVRRLLRHPARRRSTVRGGRVFLRKTRRGSTRCSRTLILGGCWLLLTPLPLPLPLVRPFLAGDVRRPGVSRTRLADLTMARIERWGVQSCLRRTLRVLRRGHPPRRHGQR